MQPLSVKLFKAKVAIGSGHREYLKQVMQLCKEHEISVIADEVQTFGRTTAPFAFQWAGLEEYIDIVTVGKMSQVCATIYRRDHKPKPGLISQTFTGSTSALHACCAVLQVMKEGELFGTDGRIAAIFNRMQARLQSIAKRYPEWIRGPYGFGGMIACTPFGGDREMVVKLAKYLFNQGLISFIAGSDPCRLRFLPPIAVVTDEQCDEAMAILERCLKTVAEGGV